MNLAPRSTSPGEGAARPVCYEIGVSSWQLRIQTEIKPYLVANVLPPGFALSPHDYSLPLLKEPFYGPNVAEVILSGHIDLNENPFYDLEFLYQPQPIVPVFSVDPATARVLPGTAPANMATFHLNLDETVPESINSSFYGDCRISSLEVASQIRGLVTLTLRGMVSKLHMPNLVPTTRRFPENVRDSFNQFPELS
jgi:hypothetical protein